MSGDLRLPLDDLLDDPIEHADLERIRRRVHASRRLPSLRSSSGFWLFAAAAALLLAVVGGIAWSDLPTPVPAIAAGPLRLVDGSALSRLSVADTGRRFAFDDGSSASLSPNTQIEAVENGADRVVLAQGEGRITFEVEPGGQRRWTIDAGHAQVDVIGTRFVVDRGVDRVRVEVTRGIVRVRGRWVAGGVRRLNAGDSIVVTAPQPGAQEELVAAEPVAAEPAAAELAAESPAPASGQPLSPPTASWRALAARGEYQQAYTSLGARGIADRAQHATSAEELFALADTARLSNHPADAVVPLRRLIELQGDVPQGAIAAFTLGRLYLEALDSPQRAAETFEVALGLELPAHLRAPAMARAAEAHHLSGHAEQAARAADRYLTAYPDGRSADRIRSLRSATREPTQEPAP